MLRIILAGIAAVALGTLGGLALNRATPERASVSELQSATIASATAVTTSRPADPAPKRIAVAAPAPKPTAPDEMSTTWRPSRFSRAIERASGSTCAVENSLVPPVTTLVPILMTTRLAAANGPCCSFSRCCFIT